MGSSSKYPDPFLDIASLSLPSQFKNALQLCEYIYLTQPGYSQPMERVISYFLTQLRIDEEDEDEKEKWEDAVGEENLNLIGATQCLCRDRLCYGNGFATAGLLFQRTLRCPRCGNQYPLRAMAEHRGVFKLAFQNYRFVATCPGCRTGSGYTGPWIINDVDLTNLESVRIKRWSPHEIFINFDELSGEMEYYYQVPESYKRQLAGLNSGTPDYFALERTPLAVLEALRTGTKMCRFEPDALFHMREPLLGGMRTRGWGIARTMTNFRQIWFAQTLRRACEAFAMDYVVPFRVITPVARSGAGNAAGGLGIDPMFGGEPDFMRSVQRAVESRRWSPDSWFTLPYPIQYQALGGDAQQLMPIEHLQYADDKILSDTGIPVELYKGTLQYQALPGAVRSFESTWRPLVSDSNRFIRWTVKRVASLLSWEEVKAGLQSVAVAEDLQKQMMIMQLAMAGKVSFGEALQLLGLDYDKQMWALAQENRKATEISARLQEEQAQAGFAQQVAKGQLAGPQQGAAPGMPGQPMDPSMQGGAAAGGAPAGGQPMDPSQAGSAQGMLGLATVGPVTSFLQSLPPGAQLSPEDLMAAADTLADKLLSETESVKRSEMRKLKQVHPALHSVVRVKMDEKRQQAASQGRDQIMQQQYGQGGAAA